MLSDRTSRTLSDRRSGAANEEVLPVPPSLKRRLNRLLLFDLLCAYYSTEASFSSFTVFKFLYSVNSDTRVVRAAGFAISCVALWAKSPGIFAETGDSVVSTRYVSLKKSRL